MCCNNLCILCVLLFVQTYSQTRILKPWKENYGGNKGFSREGPHDAAQRINIYDAPKPIGCLFLRCRGFWHKTGHSARFKRVCDEHPLVCLDRNVFFSTDIYCMRPQILKHWELKKGCRRPHKITHETVSPIGKKYPLLDFGFRPRKDLNKRKHYYR